MAIYTITFIKNKPVSMEKAVAHEKFCNSQFLNNTFFSYKRKYIVWTIRNAVFGFIRKCGVKKKEQLLLVRLLLELVLTFLELNQSSEDALTLKTEEHFQ